MNDHDLLIRIDARVEHISDVIDTQIIDIKSLNAFRNKVYGIFVVIAGITGYSFF